MAAIGTRLDEFSLTAFNRLLSDLEKRFVTLSQFPEGGGSCKEFSLGMRVTFARNYAIFYRFISNTVEVVRNANGRRNLAKLWQAPN